jgi:hypothetical protein
MMSCTTCCREAEELHRLGLRIVVHETRSGGAKIPLCTECLKVVAATRRIRTRQRMSPLRGRLAGSGDRSQ